jgi:RNA ligase
MKINELIDIDKLAEHLCTGMVSMQYHPDNPYLTILNYTHRAQHEQKAVLEDNKIVNKPIWGDGTIDWCRGLIYDREGGEIVALPFKKFHNLNTTSIPETMYENLPWGAPYNVAEKVDGSLGIYYKWRGIEGVATRGSFTSSQALFATKWMKENIWRPFWPEYATPLFEIIYPENRIVVDYQGWSGLVLLGVMDHTYGMGEINWRGVLQMAHGKMKCARDYSLIPVSDLEDLGSALVNIEGFVVTFQNGLKIKIKTAEYKRLHRIMIGMNPRTIWESLRDGKPVFDESDTLPDNFKRWARLWITKLETEYREIYEEAGNIFAGHPGWIERDPDAGKHRGDCANYFKRAVQGKTNLLPILFAMLDGKDSSPAIWKQIEPRGDDQTFKIPTEIES